MKPLLYRKKDKVTGIYAYCQKCKTCIGTGKCRKTNKRLSSCGYPEFHTFRASVIVPNTQGRKRKKRILNTKDLQEAIRLKLVFEKELKGHNFQIPPEIVIDRAIEPVEVIEAIEAPLGVVEREGFDEHEGLLIEFMDQYIGFLNNEGVEEHKVKIRTKKHIDDVKRYFKFFCLALKGKGIDHTDFRISELNDRIVGYVHAYLLHELNYQNKTYNKVMSLFRQFIGWIISERGIVIKNPFKGVNKKKEKKDDTIVTKEELHGLLGVIKPENGWNISPSGKRRYYYRGWVKTAIMIALETGLRREEFAKLKFSDIQVDENGNAYCIRVENYKVNRIKGISDEGIKDIKTIPITATMRGILMGLDFDGYIGSERFLIAPDEKVTRATIGEFTSKAFTHFWNCTGSDRKVNLKHLRKTYLTALVNHFGDKATVISDHADIEILKKHYTNNEVIMKANQGFRVFS